MYMLDFLHNLLSIRTQLLRRKVRSILCAIDVCAILEYLDGTILMIIGRNICWRWDPFQGPPTTKERPPVFQNQVSTVWYWEANYQRQDRSSNKKNDRLYQRTTYNHIHRPMGCGKAHLVLDLIEKEYNKHFDYIIIIRLTLWRNKIYHSRDWIKNDDKVWLIEPKTSYISGLKSCHNC